MPVCRNVVHFNRVECYQSFGEICVLRSLGMSSALNRQAENSYLRFDKITYVYVIYFRYRYQYINSVSLSEIYKTNVNVIFLRQYV
jgi:hypothetical protein